MSKHFELAPSYTQRARVRHDTGHDGSTDPLHGDPRELSA